MLHLNRHVPLQNIPSANPDGLHPKVLAKRDLLALPLSKVQNHAGLSYMSHQHRQLVEDHQLSVVKELDKNLICELQDKHLRCRGRMPHHVQSTLTLTRSSG